MLRTFRNSAYAHAYLALGMLAYGAGHMQQSRNYMIRAVRADPAIVTDQRLVSRYVKSFAGRRVLDTLRPHRRREDHPDVVSDRARMKP